MLLNLRNHPQGRSVPLWGAAEGRAYAFFVKSDDSVPGDVHSAASYAHLLSVWQHFANYFDNSYRSYIPYVLLNYVRNLKVPRGLILSTGSVNWSSWEGFFNDCWTFFLVILGMFWGDLG